MVACRGVAVIAALFSILSYLWLLLVLTVLGGAVIGRVLDRIDLWMLNDEHVLLKNLFGATLCIFFIGTAGWAIGNSLAKLYLALFS